MASFEFSSSNTGRHSSARVKAKSAESGASNRLVRMQQTVGNRTVQRILDVDRQNRATGTIGSSSPAHGSESTDPPHLSSSELSGEEFDAAYHDQPPLGVGDARTAAVSTLQTLLAERFGMRHEMPRTFASGSADGRWGSETTQAVRAFQQRHDVHPVGGWEAGHRTLLALDRALSGGPPVPPPAAPVVELTPPVGSEAGPVHQLGHVPYVITVSGRGFPALMPLLITFEQDPPVGAVTGPDGTFRRTLSAARRGRGAYQVIAHSPAGNVSAGFRVVPVEQPAPDPAREKRYAFFIRQATRMLRDAFFGQPLKPDFDDRFDTEFWEWVGDPKYVRALQLKPGKRPADAIDALFNRLSLWHVDCDHTVQIANLYAARMTYGAELFNHRQGLQMKLRARESTSLTTRLHYGRNGPNESWRIVHDFIPRLSTHEDPTVDPNLFVFAEGPPIGTSTDTDRLVADAPIGSRVRWTNKALSVEEPFRHENTVKIGANLYAAGGVDDPLTGNEHTKERLDIILAQKSKDRPSRSYIQANVYIDEIEVFDR